MSAWGLPEDVSLQISYHIYISYITKYSIIYNEVVSYIRKYSVQCIRRHILGKFSPLPPPHDNFRVCVCGGGGERERERHKNDFLSLAVNLFTQGFWLKKLYSVKPMSIVKHSFL